MELDLSFDHGLGDCVNFAHILELYRRRGYNINLRCGDDKAIVFAPLGVNRVHEDHPGLKRVGYPDTGAPNPETADKYWTYSKPGINAIREPLPKIGTPEEIWKELCDVRLDFDSHIDDAHRHIVEEFLGSLPRPIILLHSMGNTLTESKNIPPETAIELYRQLLDRFDGTLVLLDWDNRVPRLANWRVRHMTDDWQSIDVSTLVALMQASDLLISIDSGPLHLARMTDLPAVGIFPALVVHPARVALPRSRTVNVVPHDIGHECNLKTRILFNIVESPGFQGVDPCFVADLAARMLAGPRYLEPELLGSDLQLQQFVLEWERGYPGPFSDYNDRHRGFDILLKEMRKRFKEPLIVETGCIRSKEDWRGAGYSTYLFATYTHRAGGRVISVDIDERNCAFARRATREMGTVTVIHQDSLDFLKEFGQPIDVLYMDSLDSYISGHQAHALEEAKAAEPWLHDQSIVVMDDTIYRNREFTGIGARSVEWFLQRGWRILHSGYQTVCVRS